MVMEEKELLIQEIEAAFSDTKLGNGISLRQGRDMDNYINLDINPLNETDIIDDWKNVTEEYLQYRVGISYLDPEGFRYYLPAFMRQIIREIAIPVLESSEYSLGDDRTNSVIFHLTPHPQPHLYARQMMRFVLFSPVQSQTIARFLQMMVEYNAMIDQDYISEMAQKALDTYWGKFLIAS